MANFNGTDGADTYTGTAYGDQIAGNGGADVLKGGAGMDLISSAAMDAYVNGYFSMVSLDVGIARDTLNGGDDDDWLYAGYGDTVNGGAGSNWLALSLMGATKGVTFRMVNGGATVGGGTITNIEGVFWLQGSNYADTLYGDDREFGTVLGMGGNDIIHAGYYSQLIDGGAGDDTLYIENATYTPTMHGGDGNDTLYGVVNNGGMLYGDAGDDTIYSSSNAWGGAGNDHIVVSFGYYGVTADGGPGDDLLEAAGDNQVSLIGGAGKDRLLGSSLADWIVTDVATPGEPGLSVDDAANKDTVVAGAGDDTITAGIGDDVDGGEGNDTLRLTLGGATGGLSFAIADILAGTGTFLGGTIRGVEQLEEVRGSDFADTITVKAADAVTAVDAGGGADILISQGAAIRLLGGDGDDRLAATLAEGFFDGGAGNDTATFVNAKAGVTVQVKDEWSGGFIGGVATLMNVETVTGSRFGDTIDGDVQDNTLLGLEGDDRLRGGGGNDTLDGGSGADRLVGGSGNDIYIVADAIDTIVERAGEGIDTVKASVSVTLTDNVENLILRGSDALDGTGNGLRNVLTGNGGANVLNGMAGNDVLVGGGGADHLDGGAGSDVYVVASAAELANAVIADSGTSGIDELRYGAGTAETLVLAGVTGLESVVLGTGTAPVADRTGTAAISVDASGLGAAIKLYGNAGANTLTGTDFADVIDGGAGIDTIGGGAGNDTIDGGAGADSLSGGTGNDAIKGGLGSDTLNGDAGDDTLDGGDDADTMAGGAGNDTYRVDHAGDVVQESAGQGADTVVATVGWTLGTDIENLTLAGSALHGTGNAGANRIEGNALDNVLEGGEGNDILLGRGGNDTLKGGAGADRMEGGAGNDRYFIEDSGDTMIETASGGFDTAFGTDSFTLGAYVEVGVATGSGAVALTGNGLANVLGGNAGANALAGGGGDDSLWGGAGNDTLKGEGGDDLLFGGQGTDTLTGGAGADHFVISTASGEGADKITDFVSGTDTILVVNSYVSGYLLADGLVFGTSARDENDIAIYDEASGNLWVDYDGNGSQAKVLLATFTAGTVLAASDFQLIEQSAFTQQVAGLEMLFTV